MLPVSVGPVACVPCGLKRIESPLRIRWALFPDAWSPNESSRPRTDCGNTSTVARTHRPWPAPETLHVRAALCDDPAVSPPCRRPSARNTTLPHETVCRAARAVPDPCRVVRRCEPGRDARANASGRDAECLRP